MKRAIGLALPRQQQHHHRVSYNGDRHCPPVALSIPLLLGEKFLSSAPASVNMPPLHPLRRAAFNVSSLPPWDGKAASDGRWSWLGAVLIMVFVSVMSPCCRAAMERPDTLSSSTGTVLLSVVGHRQNISASHSFDSFAALFADLPLLPVKSRDGIHAGEDATHRTSHIAEEERGKCRSGSELEGSVATQSSVLLLFAEFTTLQAAFIGSRGSSARRLAIEQPMNATIVSAFEHLAVAYAAQMALYDVQCPNRPFVNLLFMALTDVMTRALLRTFRDAVPARVANTSRAVKHIQTVVGHVGPRFRVSRDPLDILLYGDPDLKNQTEVYLAASCEIFNTAYVFESSWASSLSDSNHKDHHGTNHVDDGAPSVAPRRYRTVDKVHLTPMEVSQLQLTPGTLDNLIAFPLGIGSGAGQERAEGEATSSSSLSACIAICFDAFQADVQQRLTSLNCSVLLQPSYNDGPWAAMVPPAAWQPSQWSDATVGSLQPASVAPTGVQTSFRMVANSMVTGVLFDLFVDGQSMITAKRPASPGCGTFYIGMDEWPDKAWEVDVLAVAAWAYVDNASQPLPVRRATLEAVEAGLLPNSTDADTRGCTASTVISASITP